MRLKTPKKFEKIHTSRHRQRRIIKQLRKSKSEGAELLADLLERCLKGDIICNSGACIICGRKIRSQFLSEISPSMRCAEESHMLTMILSEFIAPRGQLNTLELKRVKLRYERLLRVNLPKNLIVIGGIDVSLNSFENKDYLWQVHIHVIVLKVADGLSIKNVKDKLRTVINSNDASIKRPLVITKVKLTRKASAATYTFKSTFEWRSGYRKNSNLRERAPHRATRGLPLKRDDEVELRLWLSQNTMAQRLILVGVTNPASPNHIRIRPTSRTPELSMNVDKPRRGCVTRSKKVKKTLADRRIKRARSRIKRGIGKGKP